MKPIAFGEVTVSAVRDGVLLHPFTTAFPGADPDAYRHLGGISGGDELVGGLSTFIIRGFGRTMLVDTGVGPDMSLFSDAGFTGDAGLLPSALIDAGVDRHQVDTVILTHLHADHIGWNVLPASESDEPASPFFPNAKYVVLDAEWAHWSSRPRAMGGAIERFVWSIERAGRLQPVADGFEPMAGVSLLATPGHTPGHLSVLVSGGDEAGVITGDVLHHPAEIEGASSSSYEYDLDLSNRTRESLLTRAEAEGMIIMGGHFPPPYAGHVVRVEQRRRWRALGWDGAAVEPAGY